MEDKISKKRQIFRGLGYAFFAGLIFMSGWGIGSGRILLGSDRVFRKGVQKNLPENLDYSSVEQVYDSLRQNFDGELKTEDLLNGIKEGLARASGDPYTEYFGVEAADDFGEQLSGSFTGIGAELKERDKLITVEVPLAGFPAEKAGLRAKDVIIQIDDKDAYDIGTREAVKLIRGEAGTTVKLKIVRNNKQQLDLEIVRAKITTPSVKSEILEGNIGYLKINNRFGKDTAQLARQAAESFKTKPVKGIILDMRNNPGGLLDASVDVASLWVKQGDTVLVEHRGGKPVKTFKASGDAILGGVPTIVLVNEGSASASEITAGALKDNKQAKLIGTKTFGKGSVQQVVNLSENTLLKVTIARWFTPAGININKEGISPDIKVEISDDDIKADRDPQLDAAKAELNK